MTHLLATAEHDTHLSATAEHHDTHISAAEYNTYWSATAGQHDTCLSALLNNMTHICQQWMINTQHNPHVSAATEYNTHLLVTAEQHDTPASSCWTTWHTHMLTTAGQHNKHTWSVEQQAADHTTHWHSEYPCEWSADTNHNDNADITIIIDFLRGSTVMVTPFHLCHTCWPCHVTENVLNASTSHHQSSYPTTPAHLTVLPPPVENLCGLHTPDNNWTKKNIKQKTQEGRRREQENTSACSQHQYMLNQLTLTVNSQPSWKVQLAFEILTVNIFRQVNFPLKSLDGVHGYQDMWHSTSSDSARNSWNTLRQLHFLP